MKHGQVNAPWTCPTCNKLTETPFCPTCGEEALRTGDMSLRVLVFQLVESVTHVDGRLLRSFRYLLSRPGVLTDTFLKGQRRPYVGPVALFLICNALFFATELLTGGHVFTTPLDMHLHRQPWDVLAQNLVTHRLEARQLDLESYAPLFNQAVAVKARSLIIFMALVFCLAPALIFLRRKRPLIAHAVFSLHLYGFLLLLLSAALWIQAASAWFGGPGRESETFDDVLSIGLVLASAVYLYFAIGAVYGERGLSRALKTIALTVVVANVVLGYRFALFLITLYST